MDVQWQQLLTHALGFLIVLWILKKYAWGPLLSMMEERRNKIAGEFQQIEDEKVNVAKLTSEYEGKLKDIDAGEGVLLAITASAFEILLSCSAISCLLRLQINFAFSESRIACAAALSCLAVSIFPLYDSRSA